jgi:hypothetical protein
MSICHLVSMPNLVVTRPAPAACASETAVTLAAVPHSRRTDRSFPEPSTAMTPDLGESRKAPVWSSMEF